MSCATLQSTASWTWDLGGVGNPAFDEGRRGGRRDEAEVLDGELEDGRVGVRRLRVERMPGGRWTARQLTKSVVLGPGAVELAMQTASSANRKLLVSAIGCSLLQEAGDGRNI